MTDVALKSLDGQANVYPGVSKIAVPTPNGTLALFEQTLQYLNFLSYDGSIVASYSKADAAALESLPDCPSHPDYGKGEWNWTLAEIKEALELGPITVGATYSFIPSKITVKLTESTGLKVSFLLWGTISTDTVKVYWGDGNSSSHSSPTGTSKTVTYTYSEPGEYTITFEIVYPSGGKMGMDSFQPSGAIVKLHQGSNWVIASIYGGHINELIFSREIKTTSRTVSFSGMIDIKALIFPKLSNPSNVTFDVSDCPNVMTISAPPNWSRLSSNFVRCCCGLTYPPNLGNMTMTVIGSQFGAYCSFSGTVVFPMISSTPYQALYYCSRVRKIIVQEGCKYIGSYFANYCKSLEFVVFPSTVTSVSSGFLSNSSNAKIYVPDDMVDTFKTMTNLTSFASRIFPVSQMPDDD